jgi:hypothetical protein
MKHLKIVLGLLLAIGIIFSTFTTFESGTPLGWNWFVQNLWFVIGFPVLFLIGYVFFDVLWDWIEAEKTTVIAKLKKE